MRVDLKPYPEMRDAGMELPGKVPEHWEVRRLKYAVSFSGGGTPSKTNASFWQGKIPWVSPKDMTRKRISDTADHITEDAVAASAAKIVAAGAVLVVVRSGILRRTIPVAINTVPMAINQDMKAMLPRKGVRSEYLHGLIQGNQSFWLSAWTKQGATVESIEHRLLANSRIPIPPLPEQAAIARFLDDADRRIRRYIRAKERLIELLEEERQATIHEAVTGRIDVRTGEPYPAYKDSGVEWLGEAPEHWEVRRLKTLCDMQSGDTITAMSIDEFGEYRVFGGNGIRGYSSRYTHDGDYVLIGRQGALCGNVHIARGRFWASEHAVVATLHRGHVLNWFGAALETMNLNQYSIAAAQPGLSVDRVLHLWVPVPPAHEQRGVARFVAAANRRLSARRGTVARQIALLREYRTRLIADVVTGKLDVREAAVELPKTDRLADDRDRPGTISAEPNSHTSEYDMAKEASA